MWVTIESGEGNLFRLPLPEGFFTVGRAPSCQLQIAGERISRYHLRLERRGEVVDFEDLDSAVGTKLNGTLCDRGRLTVDDVLQVGHVKLQIQAENDELDRRVLGQTTAGGLAPGGQSPEGGSRGEQLPGVLTSSAAQLPSLQWDTLKLMLASLRSASDPKTVLEGMLAGLVDMYEAHRGLVLLRRKAEDRLVPVASHAIGDPAAFAAVSSTVYRQAIEERMVVEIPDTSAGGFDRMAPSLNPDETPRAILCSPLVVDGAAVGVVYLDMPRRAQGFVADHIHLFELVTDFAAEVLAARRTRQSLLAAQGRMAAFSSLDQTEQFISGQGEASRTLQGLIADAAEQEVNVLITGPTGTGKEMVARELHRRSRRRHLPFVAVNCAAIPKDMLEAELFGVEKGAYTGATARRIGRFELASPGTLFLDELGELPPDMQVKLLRVLQERCLNRLGGTKTIALDFRLICASNRDLAEAVRLGALRSDFYYRVAVFEIGLTPLKSRPEDIMPLAEYFLDMFVRRCAARHIEGFTADAKKLLLEYEWPGNVRELRNAIERAVVVERRDHIGVHSLPVGTARPAAKTDGLSLAVMPLSYDQAKERFERAFIERALKRSGRNIAAMARETGITRATIYRWLDRFSLTEQDDD